jgi:hypothetical protein
MATSMVYLGPPALAIQLVQTNTITLSGIVLPARYIYLDRSGDIQKVVGNTAQSVTPTVLSTDSRKLPLTDRVMTQYQQLLAENGGGLAASRTYLSDKYNPYVIFAHWVVANPYFSQKII